MRCLTVMQDYPQPAQPNPPTRDTRSQQYKDKIFGEHMTSAKGRLSPSKLISLRKNSALDHTAPEWCQPVKLATLSFSAFLVVCDQDKTIHVGQQILKGGNFCLLTSLLLHDHISLSILKCIIESCPARV